jgi:hypothetical protein
MKKTSNEGSSPQKKELTKNISFFTSFQKNNPSVDINTIDLKNNKAIESLAHGKFSAEEFKKQLEVRQRVTRLHKDTSVQDRLLENGIHSSQQVTQMTSAQFVKTYSKQLGLAATDAKYIYKNAVAVQEKVRHLLANIKTTVGSPYYRTLKVANVGDDITKYFEQLPSYWELFGNQDYCSCDECKSIFGAAAYFVDLQRIIDKYISVPNKTTLPADLTINARRPDLQLIELTCEKTNDFVPYIQIVIERLYEKTVALLKLESSKDVYQDIASTVVYPFNLPYNLPLNQIRNYLLQVDSSLTEVYFATNAKPAIIAREQLGFSPEQSNILTTEATGDTLSSYYGYSAGTALVSKLTDVNTFMLKTSLRADRLNNLLFQDLSPTELKNNVAHNFFINQGLAAKGNLNLQTTNGVTTFTNLDENACDRLNRFLRFSQNTVTDYILLDWLLRISSGVDKIGITNDAVAQVVSISAIAAQLNADIIQTSSLFGPIKSFGSGSNGLSVSWFDSIFNNPAVLKGQAPYQPKGNPLNAGYTSDLKNWDPNITSAANDPITDWLCASLRLNSDDLILLGKAVFTKATDLTVDNLSVLFRNTFLAQNLNLNITQYLLLLSLCNVKPDGVFKDTELLLLLSTAAGFKNMRINVYDADYFINGRSSVYALPLYQETTVGDFLKLLWQNNPAGTQTPAAKEVVQLAIADYFGVSKEAITALVSVFTKAVALPKNVTNWWDAFLTMPVPPATISPCLPYITDVLKLISRWVYLSNKLNLPYQLLGSVGNYAASYGFDVKFAPCTVANISSLNTFNGYFTTYNDVNFGLLNYVAAVNTTPAAALPLLTVVTAWNDEQTALLIPVVAEGVTNLVQQIASLAQGWNILNKLKANVTYLKQLIALQNLTAATGWSTYNAVSNQTLQKVQSVFAADQWAGMMHQLSGKIDAATRDALLAVVLWKLNAIYADITTPENVYEYLLIDVKMGDIVNVSYIKEGLNACQLYLQRCRLKIEQGANIIDIPEAWWEWIMQYREWEANRQIFVYPENYLLPSIRHSKTTPFVELESNLQQSDITETYVDESYRNYMNSFADLAKLVPVQSMRAIVEDPEKGKISTIFLLARTLTQPYTYFICSQQDSYPWTSWEKIDLAINSPSVTPVFAFNRLFIYWAELTQVTGSSIDTPAGSGPQSSQNITYSVDIKCSFLDLQNKWINAQTIRSENAIYYTPTPNASKGQPFTGIFDMNDNTWLKLFACKITNDNLQSFNQIQEDFERICLIYGPFLNQAGSVVAINKIVIPDGASDIFNDRLWDANENFTREIQTKGSGYQPYIDMLVLNQNLDQDYLLTINEYHEIDPYTANTTLPGYEAVVNRLAGSIDIIYSTDFITGTYLPGKTSSFVSATGNTLNGNSFTSSTISKPNSIAIYGALKDAGIVDNTGKIITDKALSMDLVAVLKKLLAPGQVSPNQFSDIQKIIFSNMPAVDLLGSVPETFSKIEQMQNQPGSFVYSDGMESFIFQPEPYKVADKAPKPRFSTLSEGILVSGPRINTATFLQIAGMTTENADNLVKYFIIYTLILTDGTVDITKVNLKTVEMIIGTILPKITVDSSVVCHILMDYPMVFDDAFVSAEISLDISKEIFNAFKIYSMIDANNRVALDLLTGSLANMILGNLVDQQKITTQQIPKIFAILHNSSAASDLKYNNGNYDPAITSIGKYKFNVTRITTDAVQPLSRRLMMGGVSRMIALQSQQVPVIPVLPFDRFKPSAANVNFPAAVDGTQVDFDGLYGEYFWEIFYHIPCLIADALGTNQQFQNAMNWYEYIFDPHDVEQFIVSDTFSNLTRSKITVAQSAEILKTLQDPKHSIGNPPASIISAGGSVNPQFTAATDLSFLSALALTGDQIIMVRNILLNYLLATPSAHYWQFQPFRNYTWPTLTKMLSDDNPAMRVYNDDPYNPHAIARLRIGAYEKYAVMQYVNNLIKWGDMQFTQDTWESITAATMLYVYAYDLLGPRPVETGNCPAGDAATFYDIKKKYGENIPQFLIDLENLVPGGNSNILPLSDQGYNDLDVYFCVSENTQLLSYWTIIEDRLYKIRNSMNIEGVVRILALFEPPLNPLDLAKAAAAGNNLPRLGSNGKAPASVYRFQYLIERAKELSNNLIQLGSSLLSALEKNDAEQLNLLHNTQERFIMNMNIQLRQNNISQLQLSLAALQYSLKSSQYRQDYFTTLITEGLNDAENVNLSAMSAALVFNVLGSVLKTAASIGYAVPQVGSPFAMTYGGEQIGNALNAGAGAAEIGSEIANFIAQSSLTMAGYQRRTQDWQFQETSATYDTQRIQQEIAAMQIQVNSAQQELAVLQKQIEQNNTVTAFLQSKFTSTQLYSWMVGQLSGVFYQTYQLVMSYALKAQLAYNMELDTTDSYVTLNYWNTLRKGLLSGEYLMLSLQRLEAAYNERNKRNFDVVKTVSLALTNSQQFLQLKNTGKCTFKFTEEMFDYDYPGQYARKITTLSISIPAIVGPYQNLKATLRQTYNAWVTDPASQDAVKYLLGGHTGTPPASGLIENWLPNQAIAISSGLDDNGMFTLNFDDPRYLPFENTGAVSEWELSLPKETNRFNFDTITDVIISVKYTSKYDGALDTNVRNWLSAYPYNGCLYYILQQAYASAWFTFMADKSDPNFQTFAFTVTPLQLSAFKSAALTGVSVLVNTAEGIKMPVSSQFMSLTIVSQKQAKITNGGAIGQTPALSVKLADFTGSWKLSFELTAMKADENLKKLLNNGFLDPAKLKGIEMILLYNATVF